MSRSVPQPMPDVWRAPGRLNDDDATIAYLVDLASRQSAITEVLKDIRPDQQRFSNGSVWASGIARLDGTPVLLKLGSSAAERDWTGAVAAVAEDVVPRVFGAGEFDGVGWLALERCDVRLDPPSREHRARVVTTVARFQEAASVVDAGSFDVDPLWLQHSLESDSFEIGLSWMRRNLESALRRGCPGNLRGALDRLEADWGFMTNECGLTTVHGDVHFRNVVARDPGGPALLIDAMPKSTHWSWDAADLQLAAGREAADLRATADRRHSPGLIHALAEARADVGLSTPSDLERVEAVALAWAAARWWRIAPWRHDQASWRNEVRLRVDALT